MPSRSLGIPNCSPRSVPREPVPPSPAISRTIASASVWTDSRTLRRDGRDHSGRLLLLLADPRNTRDLLSEEPIPLRADDHGGTRDERLIGHFHGEDGSGSRSGCCTGRDPWARRIWRRRSAGGRHRACSQQRPCGVVRSSRPSWSAATWSRPRTSHQPFPWFARNSSMIGAFRSFGSGMLPPLREITTQRIS